MPKAVCCNCFLLRRRLVGEANAEKALMEVLEELAKVQPKDGRQLAIDGCGLCSCDKKVDLLISAGPCV